jgi:hypothetical protein
MLSCWTVTLRQAKIILVLVLVACSQAQTKSVADVTTRISDAVCQEEAQQPNEPDWVKIACAVEGVAGGIVHVLLPRDQWNAVKGRKKPAFDAGPGK